MRELKAVEWTQIAGDPIYLRFSNDDVVETESHAAGELNVDLDAAGEVVGIELLSTDPDEIEALAAIARRFRLVLAPLFGSSLTRRPA